jgi:hypothetical protein
MGSMAGGQPAHVQIQLQQQQMQQQQLQLQKFWVEVLKEIQELDVEREFSRDGVPHTRAHCMCTCVINAYIWCVTRVSPHSG